MTGAMLLVIVASAAQCRHHAGGVFPLHLHEQGEARLTSRARALRMPHPAPELEMPD
jgi:hypothetical protein